MCLFNNYIYTIILYKYNYNKLHTNTRTINWNIEVVIVFKNIINVEEKKHNKKPVVNQSWEIISI